MTSGCERNDLKAWDNISVTAYRIISIFNMLLDGPCSDEKINEKLQEDIIGARTLSQDTIYIYINTLKALGYIITRPSKNNNYKYILKSHPFMLNFIDEEIATLVEIRRYLSNLDDWKLMVKADKLYNSIIENLNLENKKLFTQMLKDCLRNNETGQRTHLINLIEKYCDKKRTLMVNYVSPESGEKRIQIISDKLVYENGAFYLWGYSELGESLYLRVDRIKEIEAVNIKTSRHDPKIFRVQYKLTGTQALIYNPADNETIVDKNENGVLIDAMIQSKFKFIQRILSYGSDCTIISPDNIKKEVITKLKSIINSYKNSDIEQ